MSSSAAIKDFAETVPFRALSRQLDVPEFAWRDALALAVENEEYGQPSTAVRRFEQALGDHLGGRFVVATSSGSTALLLALLGLGLRPGDEVVTVSNTFVATVEAIRLVGATPVLVDVDSWSYTMDPSALEAAITPRTKAVIPVHLFGRPAAMKEIIAVARRHGCFIIEEACQAAGGSQRGSPCGALGDVAVFSFGRTKAITGLGEGGAVTTGDRELAERLHLLNTHGKVGDDHVLTGFNLRMHPLEASLLTERLAGLDHWLGSRREIAFAYNEAFSEVEIARNQVVPPGDVHGLYVYVVEVPDRDRFTAHLEACGIGWAVHYPRPIHFQSAHIDIRHRDLPVTERLAGAIVSIPLYAGLRDDEVERVRDAVLSAPGLTA